MRCRWSVPFFMFLCILFLPVNLSAQTKQDVLRSFQELQLRCESGLNFDGYATVLNEAQSEFLSFFDSAESQRNREFSEKMERALIAHQSAYLIWKNKLIYKQQYVDSEHPTIRRMLQVYPEATSLFVRDGQAPVSSLVTFFWEKAGLRIAEAKRLISGKSRR